VTVIAYKDGIIAYDSRTTSGNFIETDNCQKMIIHNKHRFFMAGCVPDEELFIDSWFGVKHINVEISAFVLDEQNILYSAGVDNDSGLWKYPVNMKECKAIGSGEKFAISAMDFGCTAREAVKYAITRDSSCGGVIRTYKI
jgi:20S proteasome alpha/beta subunit